MRAALPLLGLLALASAGYGFLCRPGVTPYSIHSDAVAYSLGAKEALHHALVAHQSLPFWQSSQMSGGPALTNPQALYFHPLHILFYLLPPSAALGPTFFLSFLLAGTFFFALARALELDTLSAFVVGVLGMFNFKLLLAAYAGWLPILPSIVLSPLLALALLRVAKRPGLASGVLFAITVGLCLHSGHIQIVYYTSVLCLLGLLGSAVGWLRNGQLQHLSQVVLTAVLGAGLGLGLSAYLVIPIFSELTLMSRSQATYQFFLSGHASTLTHLLTFLSPEALGSPLDGSYPAIELWEDDAYFGLVPLLLALFGMFASERKQLARPLTVAFFASIVLAFDTPLLHAAWWLVPGMRLFHCPSRLLFLTSLIGIVLSGLGFSAVLARFPDPRARSMFAVCVVLAVVIPGSHYARRYLEVKPSHEVLPAPEYAALLGHDHSLFRVAPLGRDTINYGWAAHLGLSLVTGYEPYSFRAYHRYFDVLTTGSSASDLPSAWLDLQRLSRPDLLEALNVKYLVAQVPLHFPDDRFEALPPLPDQPIFTFYDGLRRGPLYVYRHRHPLGRAFFVSDVIAVPDEAAALKTLERRPITGLAIVQGSIQQVGPASTAESPGDRVQVTGVAPGQLQLTLTNARRRFLVISEVWHPGWTATLDGPPLPLRRTDYALLGAWIPAGQHTLQLTFRPLHWTLARNLTLAALLILLAASILAWRRRATLT